MTKPFDIYGRVSRIGSRKERLLSFQFQERDGRAAAERIGVRVGEIISDPDESGANAARKGLLRAIKRIEQGTSGGIIVSKLDRFSRDVRQAWELAGRIHEAGGRIVSFAEQSDWITPEGELQVGIFLQFAQYERRIRAGHFDRSKAAAVERGIPVHPRLPPGLQLVMKEDGRTRLRVEHDEHAPTMAEFFRLRAQGHGPAELARFLEDRGVKTSMGSRSWSKPAIYGLIRNRAYLGELRQGEHLNPNAWDPIVDEATWTAAQKPQRRVASPKRTDHPDLIVGLARCASCGYTLNATNTSRGRRVYRCNGRHAAGRCPAPARAYAEEFEAIALKAFWQLVPDVHARGSKVGEAERLKELRQVEEHERLALELYRDDPDLAATIEAMGGREEWREGLTVRRTRYEGAHERRIAEEAAQLATGNGVPRRSTLKRDWASMDPQTRRDMLAALIDCIALRPRSSGLPLDRRVVVFAAGHGPAGLPRRGFRERPRIQPIELPA